MSLDKNSTRLKSGKRIHDITLTLPDGHRAIVPVRLVMENDRACFKAALTTVETGAMTWEDDDFNTLCARIKTDIETALKTHLDKRWIASWKIESKTGIDERRSHFPEIPDEGGDADRGYSFSMSLDIDPVHLNPDISANDGTREVIPSGKTRTSMRQTTIGTSIAPMKTGDGARDLLNDLNARRDTAHSLSFLSMSDDIDARARRLMRFLNTFSTAFARRMGSEAMDVEGIPTPGDIADLMRRIADDTE